MTCKIWFIIFFLYCHSFCQEYLWPVQGEKALTAVFGEERPGRYHTGIDIRTFGEIGYKLIAVDDGYISRIRTSSKGYGKTLYLKLNDGNTVVYAHLDHFTSELDNLVNALHEYYGKYTIDHKIETKDYSVKKGDVLGYSGDTGGVSGPHLHFEIRDKNEQPINPFNTSLNISDHVHPVANSLAIIPLNENSFVDGLSEQKVYPLKKLDDNVYVIDDTISVYGSIGLAIETLDKITGQFFNFGIYSINLLLNAEFIYSMQYDLINWENASKIYTERSYSLYRQGHGKFYHLFTHHENQGLPFINNKSRSGYTFNNSGLHDAIINIQDYAGNKIEVRAFFSSDTIPEFEYTTNFLNNSCIVTFNESQKFEPQFFLCGKYANDKAIPSEYYDMGNNTFVIENIIPPLCVLQISAKNENGISSRPTFHIKSADLINPIEGELTILQYEHGLFIKFSEKEFSGLDPFLVMEKEGINYSYDLNRNRRNTFTTELLNPQELVNVKEINIHYEKNLQAEIFNFDLSGGVVFPDSPFQIELLNGMLRIKGNTETFYDTTFIWAEPIKVSLPKEGKIITEPFFFKPDLIPFNREIQMDIFLDPLYISDHLGIYSYNPKKSDWTYLSSELYSDSLFIRTSISSGDIFAVIEEINPPELSEFTPYLDGTYYSSDLEHLSFSVHDTFAGIEGETDVILKLDGKPVIFEYNSYQKKVRYPLKYNLTKGTHTLYVQASDKVGNMSFVEGKFFIK